MYALAHDLVFYPLPAEVAEEVSIYRRDWKPKATDRGTWVKQFAIAMLEQAIEDAEELAKVKGEETDGKRSHRISDAMRDSNGTIALTREDFTDWLYSKHLDWCITEINPDWDRKTVRESYLKRLG